jgi:hypothetical protein
VPVAGSKVVVGKSATTSEGPTRVQLRSRSYLQAAKGAEKGSVDTYLAAKQGGKVTVKYTEKAGEKTAVGIEDASKATAKAVSQ